jgi:hypothetical protein
MEPQFASLNVGDAEDQVMAASFPGFPQKLKNMASTESGRLTVTLFFSSNSTLQDWSALPVEVLHIIYAKIFEIHQDCPFKTLTEAIFQINSLRLTCKSWLAAFDEQPPHLQIKILTPDEYAAATFITKYPIKSLHLTQLPSDDEEDYYTDEEEDDKEEEEEEEGESLYPTNTWLGLPIDCVHKITEGLCIGQLQFLECLQLDCPHVDGTKNIFYSDPLQSLQHLRILRLVEFDDFELLNLPLSIKDLLLVYPQIVDAWHGDALKMAPELPENLHLERMQIMSFGVLGISLDEICGRCTTAEITANCCMVGVPVPDPEVIRIFERPYREGRYVPPHILGDGEALEASRKAADKTLEYMLTGLARSTELKMVQFDGISSESLKLVPGEAGKCRAAVKFLQGVCRDKAMYLYGASQQDITSRLLKLERSKKLSVRALNLAVHDLYGDFRIFINDDDE